LGIQDSVLHVLRRDLAGVDGAELLAGGLLRNRGDGAGVIAGDDFNVHALVFEVRQGLGHIGAQLLPQDDQHRVTELGDDDVRAVFVRVLDLVQRAAEGQDAAPIGLRLRRDVGGRGARVQEDVGRSQHEGRAIRHAEAGGSEGGGWEKAAAPGPSPSAGCSASSLRPWTMASAVLFRSDWEAKRRRRSRNVSARASSPCSSTTASSSISLLVSVPVLSVHIVSTRASPSMATSALTRALYLPERTMPTAKAMEVINARPSGTIGTRAAAIERIDSRIGASVRVSCVKIVSRPVGISSQVITRRI